MQFKRPTFKQITLFLIKGTFEVLGTMIDTFVHGSINAKREEQKRYWQWREEQKKRQT